MKLHQLDMEPDSSAQPEHADRTGVTAGLAQKAPNRPDSPDGMNAGIKNTQKREASEAASFPALRRFLFKTIGVAAVVLLSLAVLFLAALLFIQLNSHSLTQLAVQKLLEHTEAKLSFANADLRLLPLPGLRLESVECSPTKETTFKARTIIIVPSVLSLLKAQPEPEELILDEPTFYGTVPVSITEMAALIRGLFAGDAASEGNAGFDADNLPMHCKISLHDAQILLADREGAYARISGLTANLSITNPPLTKFDRIKGFLEVESFQTQTPSFSAALANFTLNASLNPHNPIASVRADMHADYAISPMSLKSSLQVSVHGTKSGNLTANWKLGGTFVLDSDTIPWEVSGTVLPQKDAEGGLPYADLVPQQNGHALYRVFFNPLRLGDDRLKADVILLADAENPVIAGRLDIERASLTRWLDFARSLAPGLMHSLDYLDNGYIDFVIDKKHLCCPRIQARSANAVFKGTGGVADWSKPVVFLDLVSDFVDLGTAIPESVGVLPKAPAYRHKPLTSISMADIVPEKKAASDAPLQGSNGTERKEGGSGKDSAGTAPALPAKDSGRDAGSKAAASGVSNAAAADAEDGFAIGFDIRLGADNIHYGYIDLGRTRVVITPGQNSSGAKGVKISVNAGIYEGTCKGAAYFTGTADTDYEFDLAFDDVRLSGLYKAMPFTLVNKGRGQSRIHVTSTGTEINDFLDNLKGSVEMKLARASMADDTFFSPFDADISLRLSSAAFKKSALGMSGTWDVHYHGTGWEGNAVTQGTIWFGGEGNKAGILFDKSRTTASFRNMEKILPFARGGDIGLDLKGQAFCDTARRVFGAKNAHVTVPGLDAYGDFSVRVAPKNVQLSASVARADLETALFWSNLAGKKPDLPKQMQSLHLTKTDVTASPSQVRLGAFHTRLKDIPVSGSLTVTSLNSIPMIRGSVFLGEINLDSFLGKEDRKPASSEEKKEKSGNKKDQAPAEAKNQASWDLSFMKEFNAKGTVHADALIVKKVRISRLKLPFELEDGRLVIGKGTGSFYGGSLNGKIDAQFDKGVSFSSRLAVRQFALGDLLRERGTKGLFNIKMDFRADLAASLQGPANMARHLNGSVAFSSGKGSYQPTDQNYVPNGSVTSFNRGSMTGVLEKGVLHTDDFSLEGEDLTVTGKGDFDLNAETIDAYFEADMSGLPTVPLYMSGTFSEPKTKIGGMVIINAISGLFKGVFGFVGNIFGGLLGVFH